MGATLEGPLRGRGMVGGPRSAQVFSLEAFDALVNTPARSFPLRHSQLLEPGGHVFAVLGGADGLVDFEDLALRRDVEGPGPRQCRAGSAALGNRRSTWI